MRKVLALAILFTACSTGSEDSDEAVSPPSARSVRQAAGDLIARGNERVYLQHRHGMRDVSYDLTVDCFPGAILAVRADVPREWDVDIALDDDAPEKTRAFAASGSLRETVLGSLDLVAGSLMFDYSTEGLTLIDPRTVRIVARTAAAKQLYRERVLHYDEAGLLRQTEIAEPDGSRTVMNRTWQETDRGALLLSISGQARGIPNEMQVAWQEVDGFFVPRQITFVVDGIRVEQHVSDVRINARSR